VEEPGGDKRG